jgi:hypothetical protein
VSDRLRRLADVLVGYSGGVQPGDLTLIQGTMNVEPLLEELYGAVLRAGGHPAMRCAPEVEGLLLGEGSDDQIEWLNPAESEDIEQADVWIVMDSPSNTKALTSVDPERQARVQRARIGWRERYLERARPRKPRRPSGGRRSASSSTATGGFSCHKSWQPDRVAALSGAPMIVLELRGAGSEPGPICLG